MLRYIIKRILYFIPTLIAITLLGFILISAAPGDPLGILVPIGDENGEYNSYVNQKREEFRRQLGLDLPLFYVTITHAAAPGNLSEFKDQTERTAIRRLCLSTGKTNTVLELHRSLQSLSAFLQDTPTDSAWTEAEFTALTEIRRKIRVLLTLHKPAELLAQLDEAHHQYMQLPATATENNLWETCKDAASTLITTSPAKWKKYIPRILLHPQNQYHRWVFGDGNIFTGKGSVYSKGIVRGDFGISYISKLPLSKGLWDKISWSVLLTLLSVMMGYLVSIPLGVQSAKNHNSPFDKISSVGLYVLYSLPNFFVATLLLMFFSNPENFNWFPSSGVKPVSGFPQGAGFFERTGLTIPFLVLPLIAYTYSSFAFISRTVRVALLENLQMDYIRTARAKGLPERTVIWKHALRNSLLPIITVFANIFPIAVGGSVILETIFTIPGIGSETYNAIFASNYPVIVAVLTITGVLTMVGYLVSDILYAWADPRISYTRKNG